MKYVPETSHTDVNKFEKYRIAFIALEVVNKLTKNLNLSYDEVEKQFKGSITYRLFCNRQLDIWQGNMSDSYSKQAEFVLASYLHELEINKQMDEIKFEHLSQDNLQEQDITKIKELAITHMISINEAYSLKQEKKSKVKQKKISLQINQ